ncbi:MAG: hypothetical protein CVV25_07885 [Ignavibacteriae bacterium HGW-Ignavibacteriae-4]|jgi:hypothetical protein|nr:MAG: hypothetical protein CVV25_07885 [Ignavibacteriae bacterium HGW-Ignavibacteriae-4]
MNRNYNYLNYIFLFILLISCSNKNQNESLEQKLDTTILKVDIPKKNYSERESKYFITIGKDTSSFVVNVSVDQEQTISIYFHNRVGWGFIESILFETNFEEFKYLLTEIEKDYFLDSLEYINFPNLFPKNELEKNLSDTYISIYGTKVVRTRNEDYIRTEYVLLHTPETTRLNKLLKKYSVRVDGFSLELKFAIIDTWNGSDTPPEHDSTNSLFKVMDGKYRPRIFIPYGSAFAKFKRNVK